MMSHVTQCASAGAFCTSYFTFDTDCRLKPSLFHLCCDSSVDSSSRSTQRYLFTAFLHSLLVIGPWELGAVMTSTNQSGASFQTLGSEAAWYRFQEPVEKTRKESVSNDPLPAGEQCRRVRVLFGFGFADNTPSGLLRMMRVRRSATRCGAAAPLLRISRKLPARCGFSRE